MSPGDRVRFKDDRGDVWTVVSTLMLAGGSVKVQLDQDGRRLWTTPISVDEVGLALSEEKEGA